jgi:hypothetical protein
MTTPRNDPFNILDEDDVLEGEVLDGEEEGDPGPDLGPDERDGDLLDGTWEMRYYTGQSRSRDWNAIGVGLALLLLVALLLPLFLVVLP